MAVIVLSPLFLILSVIVYLGDPGAVIYGQVRIGKNGKPFKMWKFRSMYRNADQMIDQLIEARSASIIRSSKSTMTRASRR